MRDPRVEELDAVEQGGNRLPHWVGHQVMLKVDTPVDAAALGWAMVVSVALGFEWSLREWRRHPGWVALLGAIASRILL